MLLRFSLQVATLSTRDKRLTVLSGSAFTIPQASRAVTTLSRRLDVKTVTTTEPGAFAGLCNGLIVVKIGVPAIIATIGTQFFWRGASTLLADGLALNLTELRETTLHHILVGRLFDFIPMQTLWCLVIAIIFWMILNRHIWGDDIRFIGDDMSTATMMGVQTDNVRIGLFITMGLMSALASVMVCLEMANWWPTQGEGYLLIVFAAIFLGGTSVFGGQGTIFGTVIGSVIIQVP